MTHGRPGDFNRARILGVVHSVNRLVTGKLVGCLVSVNTGEETFIAILPGRAALPAGLREGDRVDITGTLGAENLSRRAALMYLKADCFEVIPAPFKGAQYEVPEFPLARVVPKSVA